MDRLQNQTRYMTISAEHRGDNAVFNNHSGHLLLNRFDDAREKLGVLRKQVDELVLDNVYNKSTISQLQSRVETLSVTSEAYFDVHRRFLDGQRRDVEVEKHTTRVFKLELSEPTRETA